jgi:cyclase
MLTKRIIPCLDIKNGRTVKGINFENIRDAGDPIELAQRYVVEGADELVFLDITATNEGRKTFAALVLDIAKHINIPFTVGGGISSIEDASVLLEAGADKVSINSSAVRRPELVDELAREFGSQFVVVAIDTKLIAGEDGLLHERVVTHGGTKPHIAKHRRKNRHGVAQDGRAATVQVGQGQHHQAVPKKHIRDGQVQQLAPL